MEHNENKGIRTNAYRDFIKKIVAKQTVMIKRLPTFEKRYGSSPLICLIKLAFP